MGILQNIQSAFLFVLLFTLCATMQASPLLVVASKSIVLETIAPKPNSPGKFKTWKQEKSQKMTKRRIDKFQKKFKIQTKDSSSIRTLPLADLSLGFGIAQIVYSGLGWAYIIGAGLGSTIGSAILVLIPIIGILSLILGTIAKKQIKKNPKRFSGKKKANLGILLGLTSPIALLPIAFLILLILLAFTYN